MSYCLEALLTTADIAVILKKSIHSVRHDVRRNPKSLPPFFKIPGTQRVFWRPVDVEKWISDLAAVPVDEVEQQLAQQPRRRGRPTKAQHLALKQAQHYASGAPVSGKKAGGRGVAK